MSDSGKTLPRPRQVTLAGWMIMLGSAFVVVTGYEVISGLRTLESREAIESFLSEPPGDGLGLSVEGVLSIMHVSAMVAAGCATAAAVLGFHVLRRHRGARVALAVLAVPLFLTGIVTGGFMSSLVAVASVMLWLQPARDWFDGKAAPVAEPEERRPVWPPPVDPTTRSTPPAGQATAPGQPSGARAYEGFGTAPLSTRLPAQQPVPGVVPGRPAPVGVRRPEQVVVAAIVTWLFAGFTLVSSLVAIAVVASSPDTILDEITRQNPEVAAQGVSESMLLTSTYVMGGVAAVWAALACLCAGLVLRRSAAAGRALTISAAATAGFCVLGSLASVVLAVPALASVVVLALMRRADVRAWLAAR